MCSTNLLPDLLCGPSSWTSSFGPRTPSGTWTTSTTGGRRGPAKEGGRIIRCRLPSSSSPHIPEHVQFIFVKGKNQCCRAGVGLAKNYFWGAVAVISCFGSTAPKPKKCFLFFQPTLYIFFLYTCTVPFILYSFVVPNLNFSETLNILIYL